MATEDLERHSRLPDALDAALRTPVPDEFFDAAGERLHRERLGQHVHSRLQGP